MLEFSGVMKWLAVPENGSTAMLSCKIEYSIQRTSAYLSGRSAFFTDDALAPFRLITSSRALWSSSITCHRPCQVRLHIYSWSQR